MVSSPQARPSEEWVLAYCKKMHIHRSSNLIVKVLSLTPRFSYADVIAFISRISSFTDDEIAYGLSRFFEREMDKRGYEWQYAAGFVRRENRRRELSKKETLPNLPPEVR